jgi:hypothetical protein
MVLIIATAVNVKCDLTAHKSSGQYDLLWSTKEYSHLVT